MRRLIPLVFLMAVLTIPGSASAHHNVQHTFQQRADAYCEATFPGKVRACDPINTRCVLDYGEQVLGGTPRNPFFECWTTITCSSNGFNGGTATYHGWVRHQRVHRFPGERWQRCRT